MKKHLPLIIGIFLAMALIFFVAKWEFKAKQAEREVGNQAQAATLTVKPNDWVYGNENATVTVVEYLDFECEACRAYYPITTQLKEEFKDSMRLVIRYFPLGGHRNSRTSAYAAEAAGKQGKFWEMYDLLYTNQGDWGEQETANQAQFEKYAIEIGLDMEKYRKDVTSEEVKKRIDDSYNEAMSLDLQGTPSFFLNGRKIANPQGYEAFKSLIENALKS
jgi:protein-disulfide isomerase